MTAILQDLGKLLYNALLMPGHYLLEKFAAYAPTLAATLEMAGDEPPLIVLIVVSLLAWLLLAFVVYKGVRLWQALIRVMSSWSRIVAHRISSIIAGFKTQLVCKVRQLFPRRSHSSVDIPEVEFDDLDLAVLRSAAACGPGFTTSAPELADELTLRPGKIQRSLDKLSKIKMLDNVIGSTDGFDNYRLSSMGAAYVTKWQRDEVATARSTVTQI